MHAPLAVLQSLAVLSLEAVHTEAPSPENAAEYTTRPCVYVPMHAPLPILQILAALVPVVNTEVSSPENAAESMG